MDEIIIIASDDENGDTDPIPNKPKKKDFRKRTKKSKKNVKDREQDDNTTEQIPVINELKLSDFINFKCTYCPKYFKSPDQVYEHWRNEYEQQNRKIRSHPSSFIFGIVKIFKCYHCRLCSTYEDLKSHCKQKHNPNKFEFVMVDKLTPNKCGLCFHQFSNVDDDIVAHFKEYHSKNHNNVDMHNSIKLENYLTDELVDQLIAEQLKECSSLPDDVPTDQRTIIYGCPGFKSCKKPKCTETNDNQSIIIAHIREQIVQFQCKFCEQRFDNVALVNEHHKIIHDKEEETYRNVDVMEDLDKYLEMKIIFPNGLILTKRECKRTRFGSIDEVIETVEQINASEMKAVQQQQEKQKKKPLQQASAPKRKKVANKSNADNGRVPLKSNVTAGQRNGRETPSKSTEKENLSTVSRLRSGRNTKRN